MNRCPALLSTPRIALPTVLVAAALLLATAPAVAQAPVPNAAAPKADDKDAAALNPGNGKSNKLDALPGTDPGFKSPGYSKHYPGMALVRRGELMVRLRARIETRIGLWAQGAEKQEAMFVNGDQVERVGFGIPRARIGLSGEVAKHIPFVIVTDLARGGGDTEGKYLLDAWVGYERFHYFKFYLGARTVPFARSAILSSADAGLSERSRAGDAMAPFRQVGLTVAGDYDLLGLGWRLGVYNAFERHSVFYRGHVNATGLRGNRFHGVSVVGRLQLEPLGPVGMEIADLDGGGLRIHVGGGYYNNGAKTTSTTGMEADLHVKVHGFHLFVEWIADSADPVEEPTTTTTIPQDVQRQAITAELGYTLGKNGLAVRTELIDPDTAKEDNRDEMWLSVAFNHHFIRNIARFSLQFDHREELAGQPRDNDAVFGKLALRF